MLEHGGRLREAAIRYGIPPGGWLDLSTGINPDGWPVPALPQACWSHLPEDDDGLEAAARTCYGARHLLPVAGSQAAIVALPQLRRTSRVAILHPAYAEHAAAWRRAGHEVVAVEATRVETVAERVEILVLINPNNPTGVRFEPARLLDWGRRLAERGGWLVVDEAFMDVTPEDSLAPEAWREGVVVLRSLGKFFGLPGARVGFACAAPELLERLRERLGPWCISGPARRIAAAALRDHAWQAAARVRLRAAGKRLHALLASHGLAPHGGCALFQWVCTPGAWAIHRQLARQGILVRQFTGPDALRFGLPGRESDWQRLTRALARLGSRPHVAESMV